MEDMVHLSPFQANKTTIFAMRKGEATTYPLPVVEWRRKKGVGKIPQNGRLNKCARLRVPYTASDPRGQRKPSPHGKLRRALS
jgi:hypothetical protein